MDPGRPPETLLRQPGILVTDRWFVVGSRRYEVNALSHLRTVRGPHDSLTIKAVVTTGVVLAGLGAVLTASTSGAGQPIRYGALPALGAALLVPAVLAVVGSRLRPRPYELWGEYHGLTVQLFYSADERQYGQVCRALVRARELVRYGRSVDPLAGMDPFHLGRVRR